MKAVERQHATLDRVEPEQLVARSTLRHREEPVAIGAQDEIRRDFHRPLGHASIMCRDTCDWKGSQTVPPGDGMGFRRWTSEPGWGCQLIRRGRMLWHAGHDAGWPCVYGALTGWQLPRIEVLITNALMEVANELAKRAPR